MEIIFIDEETLTKEELESLDVLLENETFGGDNIEQQTEE